MCMYNVTIEQNKTKVTSRITALSLRGITAGFHSDHIHTETPCTFDIVMSHFTMI